MSTLAVPHAFTVICRIEPGCLGPEGHSHIDGFCTFLKNNFAFKEENIAQWEFLPRESISAPEIQYKIVNKNLSHSMAARYLTAINKNIDNFEDELNNRLIALVEEYFDR